MKHQWEYAEKIQQFKIMRPDTISTTIEKMLCINLSNAQFIIKSVQVCSDIMKPNVSMIIELEIDRITIKNNGRKTMAK